MLSEYKKNLALFTFHENKATGQKEQPDTQTNSVLNDRNKGRLGLVINTTTPVFSLDELIVNVLLDQLKYTATNNLGPTKSSRLNYIFMFTVAAAYNWVNRVQPILTGTKDAWNWDTRYPVGADMDIYVFVNHALISVLPTLIPGYDVRPLLVDEEVRMNWTPITQTAYVSNLQANTKFSTWLSNWQTWYAGRVADGNVAAAVAPTVSDLPNGSMYLNVDAKQVISTYPSPSQWTPLVIQSKTLQKYLTWNWGNVSSTCLTNADEVALQAGADVYFPADRDADIANLLTVVEHLTDAEKVQAEFWAGGPYTVSPPGMFLYIWAMFARSSKFATTMGMNSFILSGLQLATTIFEVGRVVWRIKKSHMEARPIQDVRSRYAGQTLASYDGTPIDGASWLPYQTASFVTPPFADFPSGHSAFGQSFVNIMTGWFGSDIPQTPAVTLTNMYLLSPIFTTDQVQPPGVFLFPRGKSQIQPGVVPAADTTIRYTTWESVATDCGFSRQCGGIHAQSAHLGSVALANSLTPLVNSAWGFSS